MPLVIDNYNQLKSNLDFASTDAKSQGKIIIQVGSATCENAAGAEKVKNEFKKLIAASGRNDILIKQTGCTGRCSQEPIVGVFAPDHFPVKYQKVTVEKVAEIFQKHIIGNKPIPSLMLDKRTDILYQYVVTFCETNYEKRPEHIDLRELFITKLIKHGFDPDSVRVLSGGNIGLSKFEDYDKHAVMMVFPENVIYRYETEEAMDEIITSHLVNKIICEKYIVQTEQLTEDYMRFYGDVSFFNKQSRITLRNCGILDPENISDYIHAQGYKALAQILDKGDRDFVIDEILKSGLRGRGGGGFPTGSKWKLTATLSNDPIKYVICNADEGDPGAFMDRSALEGDPFSIIEGMTIGAYSMGASKGYFYIRAEYPLAIERIEKAIVKAREYNLLGDNILGSGYNFDLEIRLGAGAFVCGEETALIHSIEGKRGQPRIRPPYPSLSGLWGHPTCINNVETWANVPAILLYGSEWFNRIGTKGSKGTKVFALAGKVKNTGLIEVPMGTTLREVIYDIGGGIFEDNELKAIQTGGPSGGCIPASKVDTPIDYETLKEIGSMMGSGGMIVLDNKDCMVQTAKFFLEFTKDESCGKCLPCREGTFRMLEILQKITDGKAVMEDIDKLERLGKIIRTTSLCGLGQTAPNPVLSMIANFREEFEIHIKEHRCPTQKCQQLITYHIIAEKCIGCTLCARRCPAMCITGARKQIHEIVQSDCIKCGECFNACKFDAIEKI
jgi:NADH:ubiquinone oxidoreductase subunit F (NADH-binding)/(2Fe-2S) ferredoxin